MGREDCGIWSLLAHIALLLGNLNCMWLMQAKGIVNLPRVVYASVICLYVIAYAYYV